MIRGEVGALATAALSLPLRWLVAGEHLDREASDEPPVVFVHGILGHPTNFLVLRRALGGGRGFVSLSYPPQFAYERVALELARLIEDTCAAIGVDQVDVVGHSLGGLIARHLMATGGGHRIRRLVTLGSPYYPSRFPRNELAIFGASDPLVAPDLRQIPGRRVRVLPDCGHLGLLYHPNVLAEVAAYLGSEDAATASSALSIVTRAAA